MVLGCGFPSDIGRSAEFVVLFEVLTVYSLILVAFMGFEVVWCIHFRCGFCWDREVAGYGGV